MARTSFARTVIITYCETTYFDQQNTMHKDTVKLYGDYDIDSAQNAVKKKLNAKGALVTSVSHKSFYGSMPIETFAKYCDKRDYKEW